MCAINDITTGTMRAPFYAMNEADAKRAFKMIMDSNDLMKKNPSDFELYHVGMWDDEEGIYDLDKAGNITRTVAVYRLFKGGEVYYEQGADQTNL